MPIPGLTLHGAHTLLKSDDESAISDEPIYLPAEAIDAAIDHGFLTEGSLNDITVQPSVDQWPERWKFLKLKE